MMNTFNLDILDINDLDRKEITYDYDLSELSNCVCLDPLRRMELDWDGKVRTCCAMWTNYVIGNWKVNTLQEIWEGARAEHFRSSVIKDKTFKYCNAFNCDQLAKKEFDTDRSERLEDYLKGKKINIETLHFNVDDSCQLSCPSCRVSVRYHRDIFKTNPEYLTIANEVIDLFDNGYIERLYLTGGGDPFYNESCEYLMDKIKGTPRSHLILHTNGLGFTEDWWKSHTNLHRMVHWITISIDAGNKKSYDKVRRGGNWKKLLENLRFIASLDIVVTLNIVIQNDNYESFPELIHLTTELNELGTSKFDIFASKIMKWDAIPDHEFKQKAVWDENHPEHKKFRKIMKTDTKELYVNFGSLLQHFN